jgi:PTS system N-acetylglucosamine-specific IIC component
VVFRVTIVQLNLATPGREPPGTVTEQSIQAPHGPRAPAFVTALGGAQNLTEVEACTTRLRLVLVDNKAVDEAALKHLGAQGVIRTSTNGLQVVLGPIADQVAGEIRAALRAAPAAAAGVAVHAPADAPIDAPGLLAALGGRDNVVELATSSGRLLIRAAQPEKIDEPALGRLGIRGIARSATDKIQVLVTGPVENWSEPLRRLL